MHADEDNDGNCIIFESKLYTVRFVSVTKRTTVVPKSINFPSLLAAECDTRMDCCRQYCLIGSEAFFF